MVHLPIAFTTSITTRSYELFIQSPITYLLCHPKSSEYIIGLQDGHVLLFDIDRSSNELECIWRGIGHRYSITFLLYLHKPPTSIWEFQRSKGAIISADSGGNVTLWDRTDGRALLSHPNALDHRITCISTDSEERFLFICGWSINLVILNVSNLHFVHSMNLFDDWILYILIHDSSMNIFTQHLGMYSCQLQEHDPNTPIPILYSFIHHDHIPCQIISSFRDWILMITTDNNIHTFHIKQIAPHNIIHSLTISNRYESRGILHHHYDNNGDIIFHCLLYNDSCCSLWKIFNIKNPSIELVYENNDQNIFIALPYPYNEHGVVTLKRQSNDSIFRISNSPDNINDSSLGKLLLISHPISSIHFAYPDYLFIGTSGGELTSILFHKIIKYEHNSKLIEGHKQFDTKTNHSITTISFPLLGSSSLLACGTCSGCVSIFDFTSTSMITSISSNTCPITCLVVITRGPERGGEYPNLLFSIGSDESIGVISLSNNGNAIHLAILKSTRSRPVSFCWKVDDDDDTLFLELDDGSLDVFVHIVNKIKNIEGSHAYAIKSSCSFIQSIPNHAYDINSTASSCFPFQAVHLDMKKCLQDDKHPNLSKSLILSFISLLYQHDMNSLDDEKKKLYDAMHSFGYEQKNDFVKVALSGANHYITIRTEKNFNPFQLSSYVSAYTLLLIHSFIGELRSRFVRHHNVHGGFEGMINLFQKYYQDISSRALDIIPSLHYLGIKWADSCPRIASSSKELFNIVYNSILKKEEKESFIRYWKSFLNEKKQSGSVASNFHYAAILLGIICVIGPSDINNDNTPSLVFDSLLIISQESTKSRMSFTAADLLALGFTCWVSHKCNVKMLISLFIRMHTISRNIQVQDLAKKSILRIVLELGTSSLFPGCIREEFTKQSSHDDVLYLNKVKNIFTILSFLFHQAKNTMAAFLSFIIENTMHQLMDPHILVSQQSIKDQMIFPVTSLLYDLVKLYSFVCFHHPSQRFAVAHEKGPILIYDLKTGTKCHILEGLKHKAESVSFSPDGTMIAAFSDMDCAVSVWKITTNIGGIAMFLSGGGMKPFKVFHILSTRIENGRKKIDDKNIIIDATHPWRELRLADHSKAINGDVLYISWKSDNSMIELSDGSSFVLNKEANISSALHSSTNIHGPSEHRI